MFNNAYQNLELNVDLASGGTNAGLKDKIKSILGNKILILCGLLISGVKQLPAVCEPKIYVTQTEEPDDWNEEEDGEFVPEDVYHLEATNIYGYDIAIEDDVVTCAKTDIAKVSDIEAGTIENAKPIYFHGLEFVNTIGQSSVFYGHILNNSPDPIDSFAKFITWITSFTESVYFTGSGVMTISGYGLVEAYTIYKRANETTLNVIYKTSTGYAIAGNVDITEIFNGLSDGVNKIN